MISAARREDIVSALRRGTVPSSGLDALAVGIESFAPTLDEELAAVAAGRGGFKAVRGDVVVTGTSTGARTGRPCSPARTAHGRPRSRDGTRSHVATPATGVAIP